MEKQASATKNEDGGGETGRSGAEEEGGPVGRIGGWGGKTWHTSVGVRDVGSDEGASDESEGREGLGMGRGWERRKGRGKGNGRAEGGQGGDNKDTF